MFKAKNKVIITTLGLIIATLIGAFSCTLTWFAKLNSMNLDIGGSVLSEYFDSGNGSESEPFVITRPKHWENLVWLHNNVSNFYQAITDGSEPEGGLNNGKGYYFQVGKKNPETPEDETLYVYDYTNEGLINPENNQLNARVLNLNGLTSLIPIGSSAKPFIGELTSDGITISGFDVLGFEDRNNNLTQDAGEEGFNDVGVFGYIGKDSLISGLYFDDFTVHLANSDANGAGDNNSLHNTMFHDTDANGTLDQIYVGYIAGHIHYSSSVTNVYVNNCSMDGGSSSLSGFGYFGLAENEDGTPKPTPMEEIKATKLAGDGSGFGGSIDMYSVYDRLARIYSASPNETQTNYVSNETIVKNTVSGNDFIHSQTMTYAAPWGTFNSSNVGYRYYQTESGGVFNISTQSNEYGDNPSGSNIYQCLYGESNLHYTKTVTTYTYIDDWYECFFISKDNNYLNSRYYNDIRNVTDTNSAAGWRMDDSNHLYFMAFDTRYYLNRNGYSLVTGTNANTTWSRSENDEFYTSINGINYYLDFVDSWCLSPFDERYLISDGNSNYLVANNLNTLNSASENNATRFFITNPNGNTSIGFNYQNQIYYLSNNGGSLSVSTTETIWNVDGNNYYTVFEGIKFYIVFENNQWCLMPENGYRVSDGNGNYLCNSGTSIINNTLNNASTIWNFSSLTGNTTIYTIYNGQKYYLSFNGEDLLISTTETTWRRNGNALYVTSGVIDYYLLFDSSMGWYALPIEYYLVHDQTSSNYLQILDGSTISNTTYESEATHFYFTNKSSNNPSGKMLFLSNGTIMSLGAAQINSIGLFHVETGQENTNWSNDGTTIYCQSGSMVYYIEYDNEWRIRTYTNGYYITDGTNYMVVNGSTISNTTNQYNASIFIFSDTTGTYPTGTATPVGQEVGLTLYTSSTTAISGTLAATDQKTPFSNNGNNLYYNNTYYLSCVNGVWGFVNGVSSVSGYTISNGNYYLSVDSNGQLITSTEYKTVWNANEGKIQDTLTKRYLYLNQTSLTATTSNNRSLTNSNNILYYSATTGSWWSSTTHYYYIVLNENNQFTGGDSTSTTLYGNVTLTFTEVNKSITGTSRTVAVENNIKPTLVTKQSDLPTEIDLTTYNCQKNLSVSDPIDQDYTCDLFGSRLQNCEKDIQNNVKSGNPTYFPLRVDKDENGNYPNGYAVSPKNTGYMISGANLELSSTVSSGQDTVGDIRVAGWPVSNISGSYSSSTKTFSTIYTCDGSSNTSRQLSTAEKQDPAYQEALSQFGTTLSQSGGKVYGVHFMDASISKQHTIRANQATILGKTYYNYELPEDSIDFNVYSRGKISFFAGEYFTNNNTFFSLHKIFRDSKNDISDIKEISEIYDHAQKHDKANYIYKFSDGTYTNSDGSYTGSRTKDSMYSSSPVFKTSWITNPSGLSSTRTNKRLYYFSIACNAGEYALGSVSGKNGAYLCYLDIATNGGDTKLEEMKTTETATTFNVDYRSANEITNHSILQLGGEIPATSTPQNFSITVSFDNSADTCEGTEYSSGIYTIYVVNKTDQQFDLCVLVIDDNDDLYDDFNYAYRIIYTNNDHTEEIIECTPLNEPNGESKTYWQRLAIFEIPPDGEGAESDYAE